jgi:hypothetical protein
LPENLSQRVRALRAVVAPAHEEGRLAAKLREENGVAALRCPTCGAGLNADGAGIVTCQYCQTSSRVDARARGKSQRDIAPTPFWLLFEGASAQRGKLQNRAEAERNKLRKENQRAAQQRAEARAMDRPRDPSRRQAKPSTKRTVAAVAAGVLMCGGLTAFAVKAELDREAEKARLAEAAKRLQHQVTPHDEALQENARRLAPSSDPGKPFVLNLTMDVVKAEGQPLEPGAPCVVYATGFDEAVKELHVTCGSVALYDSTVQVFGMRMMERELYRSEDQSPSGLRYTDTGQRTNGSEITLDTKVGQGVVSSQVVPLFRVELGPHREAKPPGKRPR